MIQINAAARLSVLATNEKNARAYVKSVLGVEPGSTKKSYEGLYEFHIPKMDFDTAVAKANQAFDHPPKKGSAGGQAGTQVLKWDMGQGRDFVIRQNGHSLDNVSVSLVNF
jgi:hypothetical protein